MGRSTSSTLSSETRFVDMAFGQPRLNASWRPQPFSSAVTKCVVHSGPAGCRLALRPGRISKTAQQVKEGARIVAMTSPNQKAAHWWPCWVGLSVCRIRILAYQPLRKNDSCIHCKLFGGCSPSLSSRCNSTVLYIISSIKQQICGQQERPCWLVLQLWLVYLRNGKRYG